MSLYVNNSHQINKFVSFRKPTGYPIMVNTEKTQCTSVYPIHIWDSMKQQPHTTTSTTPNNPIFKLKLLRTCWNYPLGIWRLLPWAPTVWLWATLTQPLSWEGTEKFSEFQGNHQSTKEEGIPNTPSHTYKHTHKHTLTKQVSPWRWIFLVLSFFQLQHTSFQS